MPPDFALKKLIKIKPLVVGFAHASLCFTVLAHTRQAGLGAWRCWARLRPRSVCR